MGGSRSVLLLTKVHVKNPFVLHFNPIFDFMQQIQIIGNLGEDCQIQEFNGSRFATFRVACTEKIRRSGDNTEVTTWYSCSLNRPDAGVIPYLKKGVRVFVQGLPSYQMYDSATYHCKMIDVRIFVDRVQLCSDRKPEEGPVNPENEAAPF